ncbi:MAG: ferrochelatase [Rhodospirillales bacterium]|nr:ferrochelatase [Rhodospirillales bacterium]
MSRVAVVLLNLGGPDSLDAVEPFLRNLFRDPAIIRAPAPIRHFIARLIARRRGPKARDIYRRIGGGSPLLAETEAQAAALARALDDLGRIEVAIAMRYWHPMSEAAARQVAAFRPDRIVLLPLYPQFSTTTTASSLAAWRAAAQAAGIAAPTAAICCYPYADGLVEAHAQLIEPVLAAANEAGEPRLLFSAHGLPKKVVARGDPYQWQVEKTARRIVARLGVEALDWTVCYQSKVGPLAWLEPSIADEIERAGRDRVPVVVVPIAFVSEHSETLVELDITYRDHARAAGVPAYHRVPALGTQPSFIAALADLVRGAANSGGGGGVDSGEGGRLCPGAHRCCPLAAR